MLLVHAVSLPAWAQQASPAAPLSEKEAKAKAVEKLKEGQKRFDLGKFDDAIKLFEESYDIHPFPEALFNLGQAWRQKGDYRKAVFYYKAYLRNKPNAANRKEVEKLISESERVTDLPPDDTSGGPGGGGPGGGGDEDKPDEGKPDVVEPPVAPPVVKKDPPPSIEQNPSLGTSSPIERWYDDTWGWAITGAGVAVVGLGVGLYVAASGKEDDANAGNVDELKRQQLLEDADDFRLFGGISLGLGGVAIAAGVVKLVLTDGGSSEPTRVGFVGGHNWIGVAGRF
jgi:tetratricopeptide (TPR) repeat protein